MMSVFNASDYTVSVSTDGKTFMRIIDVTDNSLGLCEYNFEQVIASYIKINLTKGSVVDKNNYYLAEVMAYGARYTGSTDGMEVTVNKYIGSNEKGEGVSKKQIIALCILGGVAVISFAFAIFWKIKHKKKK